MDDEGIVCSYCGGRNPPLMTICMHCGKPLTAGDSSASPNPERTALLGHALLDQRDNESFDDALLRAAKELYPDRWSELFAEVSQQVTRRAAAQGISKRVAAQELLKHVSPAQQQKASAMPEAAKAVSDRPQRESRLKLTQERLAELPPQARAEAERALAAEGKQVQRDVPKEQPEEVLSLQIEPGQNGLSAEQVQTLRNALKRGVALENIIIERSTPPARKGCLGTAALLVLAFVGVLLAIVLR